MWCSTANTHLKVLHRVVFSTVLFLYSNWGLFECDIPIVDLWQYCVVCTQSEISCNPMHTLNGALPGPCVPVRVTPGAPVAHRYTYASPSSLQNLAVLQDFPLPVSLWNDLADHFFRWCGTSWFQEQGQCFFIGLSCSILTIVFYSFCISLLFREYHYFSISSD